MIRADLPAAVKPGESGLDADIRTIAIAWRNACGQAIHGPSCSCCGGQPVVVHAGALAEGIEHSLRWRYRGAADTRHARLLDARPMRADEDLVAWLRALAGDADDGAVRDILDAVRGMLGSIEDRPGLRR